MHMTIVYFIVKSIFILCLKIDFLFMSLPRMLWCINAISPSWWFSLLWLPIYLIMYWYCKENLDAYHLEIKINIKSKTSILGHLTVLLAKGGCHTSLHPTPNAKLISICPSVRHIFSFIWEDGRFAKLFDHFSVQLDSTMPTILPSVNDIFPSLQLML